MTGDVNKFVQIDARINPHAMQHPDDVFSGTLPVAPAAKGHPPSPATEVSNTPTPTCHAASTLAVPRPYVSFHITLRSKIEDEVARLL